MALLTSRAGRLGLAAAAVAVALFAGLGVYKVRPGEVALRRGSGGTLAGVAGEGWRWRPPLLSRIQRVPRAPIPITRQLSLPAAEGSPGLEVVISGRFGLAAGGERAWVSAVGREPFVDALAAGLEAGLDRRLGAVGASEPFSPAFAERLASLALETLREMGVAAESVEVTVPPDQNAGAVARVHERLAALAAGGGGRKVLVVGWDGADWLMIRPLLAAGKLPNLKRLIDAGVSGELRTEMPMLSPLLWTTIATGKPVLEHGVADFLVKDPQTNALVPISSDWRKVRALWNLLEPFGLRTDVVAWWATWPAEPILGTMVSDRVAYQLFELQETANVGKVHPPEAWDRIERLLVPAESVDAADLRRFIDVEPEEVDRLWKSLPPDRRQEERVNHLRKILATTRSYQAILLSLLERQADLTLAYYEGTDTVGHLFARYLPPRMPGVSAEEVRRFGSALPEFYGYADELLGELLERIDENTAVLLVSDHGFFTGSARPTSDPSDFGAGAPQWHRLYGVIVAAGAGIGRGTVEGATIYDVAPTVLALLGLPVPQDMGGRVLPEIVGDAGLGERLLASYEILPRRHAAEIERSPELDRERLRELAALGYLSSSSLEEAPQQSAGEDLQGVATEAYNRGRILQRKGDFAAAQREYRTAIERMPGFGPAYASLAQLESLQGRHCQAFDVLVRGFTRSSNLPMSAITGLVDEAAECGRLKDAEPALERLHSSYTSTAAYASAYGLLLNKLGRFEEALARYRQALEIDPLDQLANEEVVTLLRRQGREAEARQFLAAAFEKAAGQVQAMNQLAVVALRQGWAPQAEALLRQVLEADPGNAGVLANLAASLMQQRRVEEASRVMREALVRDPENARNYYNLGAMLAEQGRIDEALESFNKAAEKGLRSARVHVAAAKMRFRLGDRAGAARDLEKALELEPGDAEATQLLQVLRQG